MTLLDYLITQRVYSLLETVDTFLSPLLAVSVYAFVDIQECRYTEKFFVKFPFQNGMQMVIREAYALQRHQLMIQYNYTLLSATGQPILSYDNRPHHPAIPSFPHHKHYYPKSRYTPVAFSSDFIDVVSDIKWVIEHR